MNNMETFKPGKIAYLKNPIPQKTSESGLKEYHKKVRLIEMIDKNTWRVQLYGTTKRLQVLTTELSVDE